MKERMKLVKNCACAGCGGKLEGSPKDFTYRIPDRQTKGPTFFMHEKCAKLVNMEKVVVEDVPNGECQTQSR